MDARRIGVLIGTRPGIIKMAPLVHELRTRGLDHLVIHTGQHYSKEMDQAILEDTGINKADYHLRRPENCTSHAQQTAYMLTNLEEILLREKIGIFLVCGDANTNMAGALAARKIHVQVGHTEAGLRSEDWRMPEEHNRVIIDHISEYLFVPTVRCKNNLLRENVRGQIFVTGNTIVDALHRARRATRERNAGQPTRLAGSKKYVLLTLHREENVDNRETLAQLLTGVGSASRKLGLPGFFPVHPRTQKRMAEYELSPEDEGIEPMAPQGYLDFVRLQDEAELVLTDSGGIQEESCILGTPCVTLRQSTERQETVEAGANILAGTHAEDVVDACQRALHARKEWSIPFGDGRASQRIIDGAIGIKVDEWSQDSIPAATAEPRQ